MKKVLFLSPSFLPHLGGVETHVSEISKLLAKKGWQITILTVQNSSDQLEKEKISYATIIRIPLESQKNKITLWKWIHKYFSTSYSGEIIHVHDIGWWILPEVLFNKNLSFYITFHGWEGVYPVRWQAKFHRLIISKLAKAKIHVGGFIQKFYWDKPDLITYGGVIPEIQKKVVFPDKNNLNIVFLGRLEKENNIEMYVLLLSELVKRNIPINVTWVGDGSLRNLCDKWGTVTGMVTDPHAYIESADFVFASSYLSILQAQAAGKVVCALYDNPLKQAYLETFPGKESLLLANESNMLATQIEKIISDPLRYKSYSEQSYYFAQSQSWNRVADLYEEMWLKNT